MVKVVQKANELLRERRIGDSLQWLLSNHNEPVFEGDTSKKMTLLPYSDERRAVIPTVYSIYTVDTQQTLSIRLDSFWLTRLQINNSGWNSYYI